MTQELRKRFFTSAPYPMLTMSTEESTVSRDKRYSEIFKEVESLQKEILYYIDNYLPELYAKKFVWEKEVYPMEAIRRQFRLMCLMFQRKLKKYNLDPRQKVLIFLNPKCRSCGATENLEIHHRHKDGKRDRASFEDYGVFIWTYYLIHLEEADARLKVLCGDCHEVTHNGEDNFLSGLFEEFFGR